MRPRDRVSEEMALTSRFLREVINDPSILDEIPAEAYVFLLPDDDPKLAETNMRGAAEVERAGHPVYIRRLSAATLAEAANLRPKGV